MTALNVRTLTSALLVATAFSGCAWRRLDPPRVERPVLPLVDEAVGLLPADSETSWADLQSLSRIWTRWGAFRAVQFPYREGDPVKATPWTSSSRSSFGSGWTRTRRRTGSKAWQ